MPRRREEWATVKERAQRVLNNGTTSGSARALAKDVLALIDDMYYWRAEAKKLGELVKLQLKQLERYGETTLVAEAEQFLRDQDQQ